jgi:predicted Holliday junction resolvase-like endonuclease
MEETKYNYTPWIAAGILFFVGIIIAWMVGMPKYRIYKQDLQGQANLRQQEWEKKIQIEEARGKNDAAALIAEARIKQETANAQAEVIRAEGVKKANEIIQASLGGSEGYLRYLYIQQLADFKTAGGQVIYVPTEAGLPVLEAGKRP